MTPTPTATAEIPHSAVHVHDHLRFPARYGAFIAGSLVTGALCRWAFMPTLGLGVFVALSVGVLAWCLTGGREAMRRARKAVPFLAAAMLFAAFLAIRASPLLATLNCTAIALLLLFAAHDSIGGALERTRVGSWFVALGRSLAGTTLAGIEVVADGRRRLQSVPSTNIVPVLRGVVMATPVVMVLGALLTLGDVSFRKAVFSVVDLGWSAGSTVVDYALTTLGFGLLTSALVLFSLRRGEQIKEPALDVRAKVGFIEGSIVLSSVSLLFTCFLVVLAQHLFFENPLEKGTGLTFADNARQGFGELSVVAVIACGVVWLSLRHVLAETTRREWWVRLLSTAVVGQVLVIVVSAWSRLSLYIETYGLTVARVSAQGLIGFLALAVTARLLTLWVARQHLAKSLVAIAVLTLVTFNAINPEARVVTQNLQRDHSVVALDIDYLRSLSADAQVALTEAQPSIDCMAPRADSGFASWNLSRSRAAARCTLFEEYVVSEFAD